MYLTAQNEKGLDSARQAGAEITLSKDVVEDIVIDWMSRNWSEIQDGAFPELERLTFALQSSVRIGRSDHERR